MTANMPLMLSGLAFPNIDPIALSLGPLQIHWYGLGYIIGILFAWYYARKLINTPRLWAGRNHGITDQHLDDFVFWAAMGVILGGRFGYAIFYNASETFSNPLSIFAIWQGGMSFHGGFIGCTLAMVFYAQKHKLPILSLFDVVAAGVPIGLGLVRVTNFINGELWGRKTDLWFGVVFPNTDGVPRHASQLYEAFLEGVVLFIVLAILVWTFKALKRAGLVSGIFVAGYGISRTIAEFFREPDAHIGYLAGDWLTMGMVLSLPMVAIGLFMAARSLSKNAPTTA